MANLPDPFRTPSSKPAAFRTNKPRHTTPANPVFCPPASSPLSPTPGILDFSCATNALSDFSLTGSAPAPAPAHQAQSSEPVPAFQVDTDTADGLTPRLLPTFDSYILDSSVTVLDDSPTAAAPTLTLPTSVARDVDELELVGNSSMYSFSNMQDSVYQPPTVKQSPSLVAIDSQLQHAHIGNTLPADLRLPEPMLALRKPTAAHRPKVTASPRKARRKQGGPSPSKAKRHSKPEPRVIPEPWNGSPDIDQLTALVGELPSDVAEALYLQVKNRAECIAQKKKLLLREELKKTAGEEAGTASEISSRREAKVSRKYQQELKVAMEGELRENLKVTALLWATVKKFKHGIELTAECDEEPSSKRQRMTEH